MIHLTTRNAFTALAAALSLAACAAITPDLPPITDRPTGLHNHGKIVWHDLLTSTPAESRKFYGELFGWTFEKPGIDIGIGGDDTYMLIRHDGRLIGGMLDANSLKKKENVSQWLMVMSVDDIYTSSARAAADGGTVLTPPTELDSRGWLSIVEDSTGAVFVMLQTKAGDPLDSEAGINGFLWDELWTNDVAGASDFYRSVIGFTTEDHLPENKDRTYRVLKTAGEPRAAIMTNPFGDVPPVWVNYLRVEDPAAITARVESLGGQILVEAQPRPMGGTVAFVAGPSGAGIALQTWPID